MILSLLLRVAVFYLLFTFFKALFKAIMIPSDDPSKAKKVKRKKPSSNRAPSDGGKIFDAEFRVLKDKKK